LFFRNPSLFFRSLGKDGRWQKEFHFSEKHILRNLRGTGLVGEKRSAPGAGERGQPSSVPLKGVVFFTGGFRGTFWGIILWEWLSAIQTLARCLTVEGLKGGPHGGGALLQLEPETILF